MKIDITESIAIRGWMSENELAWLAEQANTHKLIVEVGCYAGRSTRTLANHTAGRVYTVDDFKGADNERPLSPEASRDLYLEFKKNLQDHIDSKKVIGVHPDDLGLTKNKIVPDMVFIDGDHSYEGVSKDIKYWMSALQSGGLLCGHDSGHPPIREALANLVPNVAYVPSTTIWYITKD